MPPLHPIPTIMAINTEEGYRINPLTGDNILPVITQLGDTMKTGAAIPVKATIIHPDRIITSPPVCQYRLPEGWCPANKRDQLKSRRFR